LWALNDAINEPVKILQLIIITGDTGGTLTIQINGLTFYTATDSGANTTTSFNFATPFAADSVQLAALGTNSTLIVRTV